MNDGRETQVYPNICIDMRRPAFLNKIYILKRNENNNHMCRMGVCDDYAF